MRCEAEIIALIFLLATVSGLSCPPTWSVFNNTCYILGKVGLNFLDAQAQCRQLGGYLVEIGSSKENDFVTNLVQASGFTRAYIGALWFYDVRFYWDFSWDSLEHFSNWANAGWKPDPSGKEYCGAICKCQNWDWDVLDCKAAVGLSSVCERKPVQSACSQSSCYRLLPDSRTMTASRSGCKGLGGLVLQINSEEEGNFIKAFLVKNHVSRLENGAWSKSKAWLDITTNSKLNYQNWMNGDPQYSMATGRRCVVVNPTYGYKWTGEKCDNEFATVCELPKNGK